MYVSLATAALTRIPVGVRCSSDADPRRPTRRGFGDKGNTPPLPGGNRLFVFFFERLLLPVPGCCFRLTAASSQCGKSSPNQFSPVPAPTQAPWLSPKYETSYGSAANLEFEERLKTVKRSAIEQKNAEEKKQFGAIDYDSLVVKEEKTTGLGTKGMSDCCSELAVLLSNGFCLLIRYHGVDGIGVAIAVFGLVFAFEDFLPSGSVNQSEQTEASSRKLSEEQRATFQSRLKQFEATLTSSPKDPMALEGAAVTLAELGESAKAASRLEELLEVKPDGPEVYRLLAEVKFELRDFEGSVAAYKESYKESMTASKSTNFEVLRGITNALIDARKPDEVSRLFKYF